MGYVDAFAAETLTSYRQVEMDRQFELRRAVADRATAKAGSRLGALFPLFSGARTLRAA